MSPPITLRQAEKKTKRRDRKVRKKSFRRQKEVIKRKERKNTESDVLPKVDTLTPFENICFFCAGLEDGFPPVSR